MVVINAKGKDNQAHAELVSSVSTIDALYLSASDGEIKSDTNQRLNVTHLSTAKHLLSVEINNGVAPATNQQQADTEMAISSDKLLDLAAFIKLIVDHSDYTLKAGQTTLTLLNNKTKSTVNIVITYLTQNGAIDSNGQQSDKYKADFSQAVAATLKDPKVMPGIVNSMIVGRSIITPLVQLGQPLYSGDSLSLNADGTGFYSQQFLEINQSSKLTWQLRDNSLTLALTAHTMDIRENIYNDDYLVNEVGFEKSLIDFLIEQHQAKKIPSATFTMQVKTSSLAFQLVSSANNVGQVIASRTATYSIDSNWLSAQGWTGAAAITTITTNQPNSVLFNAGLKTIALTQADAVGTWALPIYYSVADYFLNGEQYQANFHDLVQLHNDGSTTTKFATENISWSLVDGVIELNQDKNRYRYIPVQDNGFFYTTIVEYYQDDQLVHRFVKPIAKQSSSSDTFNASLVTKLPTYLTPGNLSWLASSFDRNGKVLPNNINGYWFKTDGTMTRITATDKNYRDICTDNTQDCIANFGPHSNWELVDGWVKLYGSNRRHTRSRFWLPLASANGVTSVLEYSVITGTDDPKLNDSYYIKARLNTIFEDDLSQWSSLWQNSALNDNPNKAFNIILKDQDGNTQQVTLIHGMPFTKEAVVGTWIFDDIDIKNSQKYTIVFNQDGTGTSVCCDNSFTSTITWQVDANGLLNFIETDDEGNKYIMQLYPIIHADFKFMVKVNTPTGQEESINAKVLVNGTKQ